MKKNKKEKETFKDDERKNKKTVKEDKKRKKKITNLHFGLERYHAPNYSCTFPN